MRSALNVVSLVFKGLDYSKKLLIVCVIVPFGRVYLAREEGYRVLVHFALRFMRLGQYYPDGEPRGICYNADRQF